jgi:hypothetical protein
VENIPGHRDHPSDDRDQLIGISPERVIAISPERVIGMPRNTDRHRPESPERVAVCEIIETANFHEGFMHVAEKMIR